MNWIFYLNLYETLKGQHVSLIQIMFMSQLNLYFIKTVVV